MTHTSRLGIAIVLIAVTVIPAGLGAQTKGDTVNVLRAVAKSFPSEKNGKKVGLSTLMAPAEGQLPKQLNPAEKEKEKKLIADIASGRFVMVEEAAPDAESRKQWLEELRKLAVHYALGPVHFNGASATIVVYEGSAFEGGGLKKLGLNVWNYSLEKKNGRWSIISTELIHSTTFTPDH